MILPTSRIFVFDLDDTLYSERDFERSGIEFVYNYLEIRNQNLEFFLKNRSNWIELILENTTHKVSIDFLLNLYRNHFPAIRLYNDAKVFLDELVARKIECSLITDGRSITQRNKLKALGIESIFKKIIISEEIQSEKPSEVNYCMVIDQNIHSDFVYIADNLKKDFYSPNKLGWTTICLLDRGQNIHKQNFDIETDFLPQFSITTFEDIKLINEQN